MEVKVFVNYPWEENTVLLYDKTREAVVIDCGCLEPEDQEAFLMYLSDYHLKVKAILNTHLHPDHVFGNKMLTERLNIGVQASQADDFLIENAVSFAAMLGIPDMQQPPKTSHYLSDGDVVSFGVSKLRVISVAGHSPGGLCFYSSKDRLLVSGDNLFVCSVGRSDFPGGNGDLLLKEIQEKLFVLPDDVRVIPGHGGETTIGNEKKYNPYFK